jgi:hypothetical protein
MGENETPHIKTPEEAASDLDMFIDVGGCARCEGDHIAMRFTRFVRHAPSPWTHWGTCPVTGAPVLLISVEDTEPADDGKD